MWHKGSVTGTEAGPASGLEDARQFGRMRGQRVHQRRIQAVVGLETQFLEATAHRSHVRRICARLDDRGDECGESRCGPARFGRQLRMDEIESVKGVLVVLYPAC